MRVGGGLLGCQRFQEVQTLVSSPCDLVWLRLGAHELGRHRKSSSSQRDQAVTNGPHGRKLMNNPCIFCSESRQPFLDTVLRMTRLVLSVS